MSKGRVLQLDHHFSIPGEALLKLVPVLTPDVEDGLEGVESLRREALVDV